MFAVIFRAKSGIQGTQYTATVARMREIAFEQYGCIDFVSATEGEQEIAISYWETEEAIIKWKSNAEHTIAQELGQSKWYESYIVQVAEIKREYKFSQ
jgi:heme-degrading monooxygenase HmoA